VIEIGIEIGTGTRIRRDEIRLRLVRVGSITIQTAAASETNAEWLLALPSVVGAGAEVALSVQRKALNIPIEREERRVRGDHGALGRQQRERPSPDRFLP